MNYNDRVEDLEIYYKAPMQIISIGLALAEIGDIYSLRGADMKTSLYEVKPFYRPEPLEEGVEYSFVFKVSRLNTYHTTFHFQYYDIAPRDREKVFLSLLKSAVIRLYDYIGGHSMIINKDSLEGFKFMAGL